MLKANKNRVWYAIRHFLPWRIPAIIAEDVARTTKNVFWQKRCVRSKSWIVRLQAALNPYLLPELREVLKQDEYAQIRGHAAQSTKELARVNECVFPGIRAEDVVL